jgi:hypothetical protein
MDNTLLATHPASTAYHAPLLLSYRFFLGFSWLLPTLNLGKDRCVRIDISGMGVHWVNGERSLFLN